jgi:hypothetical protein
MAGVVDKGGENQQRGEHNVCAGERGPPEFSPVVLVVFEALGPWITVEEIVESLVCRHREAYGQLVAVFRRKGMKVCRKKIDERGSRSMTD